MTYQPKPIRGSLRNPLQSPVKTIPSHIGEEGLLCCYLMDYITADTVIDCSRENNDGSISGAEWVDGRYGWALDFDGVDDYVAFQKSFPNFSELTIIIWSLHRAVNDGNYDSDVRLAENNNVQICDVGDGTGKVGMRDKDGNWHFYYPSISNNVWNMWTLRWDGSDVWMYKNDTLGNTEACSSSAVAGRHARLGIGADGTSRPLDGIIGMVWIFNVCKSEDFIFNTFEETRGLFGV